MADGPGVRGAGDALTAEEWVSRIGDLLRETLPDPARLEAAIASARRPEMLAAASEEAMRFISQEVRRLLAEDTAAAFVLSMLNHATAREVGSSRMRGECAFDLGLVAMQWGRYRDALSPFEEALGHFREAGETVRLSGTLGNLGGVLLMLGDIEHARGYFEEALRLSRESGAASLQGKWAASLGNIAYGEGRREEALAFFLAARAAGKEAGDPHFTAEMAGIAGALLNEAGRPEEALPHLQEALAASRERSDRAAEGQNLGNIGVAYRELGNIAGAKRALEEALALARASGHREHEGIWLGNLGNLHAHQGEMARAISFYQQAREASRAAGDTRNEQRWLYYLGVALQNLSRLDEAREAHQQGLALARALGDRGAEANQLSGLGNSYQELGMPGEALALHEQALVLYRATGDRRGEASALLNAGAARVARGDAAGAISTFNQALALNQELADHAGTGLCYGNLAYAYYLLGDLEACVLHAERALAISREREERRNEARWLNVLGLAYGSQGAQERALGAYREALRLHREVGDSRGEGVVLVNLGVTYHATGEVEPALETLQQALAISRDVGARTTEGNALVALANVYLEMGRGERAQAYLIPALEISGESGDRRMEGKTLELLGRAHDLQEQEAPALAAFEEGLAISRAIGDRDTEGSILGNIGSIYLNRREPARAIPFLEQALAISREIGDRRVEALWLGNLAIALDEQGDPARAAARLEEALAAARESSNPALVSRMQEELGDLHASRPGTVARAFARYREAIDGIEALHADLESDTMRQEFLADRARLYRKAIAAGLRAGPHAEALHLLERSKTRFLSDLLTRRDAVPLTVPAHLRQQYRQAMEEVQQRYRAYLDSTLAPAAPTINDGGPLASPPARPLEAIRAQQRAARARQDEAMGRLDAGRQALRRLEEMIREHDPAFARVRGAEPLACTGIAALLPPDGKSAVVEFAVLEGGSVAFVVRGGATTLRSIRLPGFNLQRLADLLLGRGEEGALPEGWLARYLYHSRGPTEHAAWLDMIEAAADELGERFWRPLRPHLKRWGIERLILVPHLALHLLPLHLMRYPENGRRPLLLDEFVLSYVPSATVLEICRRRVAELAEEEAPSLLAFADPTGDLPFALHEADSVEALFEARRGRVTRRNGTEATREAILEAAGHRYLHLACHGEYNWRDPMASTLLLYGVPAPDPLTLARIQRELDLRAARLVTLSACESGITRLDMMDESVGLPSAFLLAGAPAVVSSLWAVSDLSTALLMAEFYRRHLDEGEEIAAALCGAQRWMRRATAADLSLAARWRALAADPRLPRERRAHAFVQARYYDNNPRARPFRHPYYWAAFSASGAV